MLLAIDIGNTNMVFAVYKGEALNDHWRCRTVAARSGDEYAAFLSEVFTLGGLKFADITDVIISSVVPEAQFHIKEFCRNYLQREPVFVTHDMADVSIDIDRPQEIGADRLVNAVAVIEHYQSPAIVIDFGTATTFDVISKEGQYLGGVITPGVNLSVSALQQAAAKLPAVSIQKPDKVIGKNTVEAIQSGIYWGYLSMIEGMVENIKSELGAQPFVIATGGLAGLFANNTDSIQTVDDELTLKGLLKIYQNTKGA